MSDHDPLMANTDRLLAELVANSRISTKLMFDVVLDLRKLLQLLKKEPENVTGFNITLQGDSMVTLDPGATGAKLVAVPTPAGAVLPSGATLAWTSSDPLVTVTTDPEDGTGLTADLSIAATETVGAAVTITLTATGTNADGSALSATGTFAFTVGAVPVVNVTGFVITQAD